MTRYQPNVSSKHREDGDGDDDDDDDPNAPESTVEPEGDIDGSPLGSLVPGILQARTLEWGAMSIGIHQKSYHVSKGKEAAEIEL